VSLDNSEVLDLISHNATGDIVTLHLIVTEPWPADGEGALHLQAKLKNYIIFATDGQLIIKYPYIQGKQVRIEIQSTYPLGEIKN
jgi:hypothetical protein